MNLKKEKGNNYYIYYIIEVIFSSFEKIRLVGIRVLR